ncbi:MAG: signal peptidase II [Bdellovibrionales bacterium]|nr:signal peptidase II [Bdellovibrionales bacterium]
MYKIFCAIIFFYVLVMDQYTKVLAIQRLSIGRSETVVDGLFNLTLLYNPGAAFGLFSNLSENTRYIALTAVTIIAFVVIFRLAVKEMKGDAASLLALSAIFGGAVGNLVDRFRYGAVVDFLDFYVGTYHWPSFNIADSAISIGVTVVIIRMIFGVQPEEETGD